ncbi:MAG: tRNA (adenosine(37)-N6)-dimethylallyltransferase MiaA [Chlorobi bacterium]|nr:tRNA (adenosine(37)-N6)-dimethylallyltransferase MiaA [Chlorobiota bacterium]
MQTPAVQYAAQAYSSPPLVIVVQGPTASGKTELAHALAERLPIEIISADSRQVWQGLDIGTAKPTIEERSRYRYHGLDLCPPDTQLSAGQFARQAWEWIEQIASRGAIPLIVGGSGLYVRAITEGLFDEPAAVDPHVRARLIERLAIEGREALFKELSQIDPQSAARIPDRNPRRILRALEFYYTHGLPLSQAQQQFRRMPPPMRIIHLTLLPERSLLYRRINQRTYQMWHSGLLEETQRILQAGFDRTIPAFTAIGYAEALAVLDGRMDQATAIELCAKRSRHYAKRQYTWLRHSATLGIAFHCFGGDATIRAHDIIAHSVQYGYEYSGDK